MISLPGLTFFTGKAHIAKSILRNLARDTDKGMLPNRFAESGQRAEYNTADATLWFFEAARAYAAATGDHEFVREELYPVFTEIMDFHIKGTRYNIKMAQNGLLDAGAAGVQLTWMDAKAGDLVVTPRSGKPVEIEALWYNALRIMEDLAAMAGEDDHRKRYSTLASMALWSFNPLFWNKEGSCLFDVGNGGKPDASVRPNQILAVSLHHSMLSQERARAVVQTVERELLTPVGLRSLRPSDPRYVGHYRGDQYSRDSSYHQGTVWPWMLGPFVTAYLRINGGRFEAREHARELLRGLTSHLEPAAGAPVSEIFAGCGPAQARRCFAQAWRVAEVLRGFCECIIQTVPKAEPPINAR